METVGQTSDEHFERAFNELLVSTYRSIDHYEESVLRHGTGLDLTISEAHVIDAVGHAQRERAEGATVSSAAEILGVSLPTVTASANRLVAKGFLAKNRSPRDARVVNLCLTRSGEKAYRLHAMFHQRLTHALLADLETDERDALVRGIRKLEAFFSAPVEAAQAETDDGDGAGEAEGLTPAGTHRAAGETMTHQEV